MKCETCLESIDSYVLHECDAALQQEVGRHLITCSSCAEEARTLELCLPMLGRFEEADPPAALRDRTLRIISDQLEAKRENPGFWVKAARWLTTSPDRAAVAWTSVFAVLAVLVYANPGKVVTAVVTAPVKMVQSMVSPDPLEAVTVRPVLIDKQGRDGVWTVNVTSPNEPVRVRSFLVKSVMSEHSWTPESLGSSAAWGSLPNYHTEIVEKAPVQIGPIKLIATPKRDVGVMVLSMSANGESREVAVFIPASPSLPVGLPNSESMIDLGSALHKAATDFQIPIVTDLKRNAVVNYTRGDTALETLRDIASQAGMTVENMGAGAYRVSD